MVGDVMGRRVYCFTAEDNLSSSTAIQRALQTPRGNPGFHLHGEPAMHTMDFVATSQPSSRQPGDQGPHRAHL